MANVFICFRPQILFKVKYDASKPKGQRVVEVTLLNGAKLDNNKSYKVVTNDFLYDGGDGYSMFKQGRNAVNTFLQVRESYAEQIKKASPNNFRGDQRLIETGAADTTLVPAA